MSGPDSGRHCLRQRIRPKVNTGGWDIHGALGAMARTRVASMAVAYEFPLVAGVASGNEDGHRVILPVAMPRSKETNAMAVNDSVDPAAWLARELETSDPAT